MKIEAVRLRDHVRGEDGTSAVMIGTDVLVLSAMATELLSLLAGGPLGLPAMTAGLVQTFGAPAEDQSTESLVLALVEELERLGVVRHVTNA